MRSIGVVLLTVMLFGCEDKIKPSRLSGDEIADTAVPSQESWKATVVISDSGKVRAILKAGHISVYDDRMMTHMDREVTVDFYDTSGIHTSVLTSREAWVNDRTKNLEARGDVVVKSDNGSVLVTEVLYWNNARRKVHTDEFVKITTPDEAIQGRGFESDETLRYYKVFKVSAESKSQQ